MVVLAGSIVTKSGKILLSRQFVEMSRGRIESLLAAFPKLVGTGRSHTFVETESVRYVYQPLENLLLLLITNKSSNIIEDLDTLRTFAKIIPEYCRNLSEQEVSAHAFDLIFAFDELISLGLREHVTPFQLKAAISMDSASERAWEIKQQQQYAAAQELMAKRAEEIERLKRMQGHAGGDFISSGGGGGRDDMSGLRSMGSSGSIGGAGGGSASAAGGTKDEGVRKSRGLQLGKRGGGAADALLRQMAQEGAIDLSAAAAAAAAATGSASASPGAPAASPGGASVRVTVEEKISAQLPRDGGVQALEIRGELTLLVLAAVPGLRIALRSGDNAAFNFKTHPQLDRRAFTEENVLLPRDPQRPFPVNASQAVVKWHVQSQDDRLLPLSVTCWPSVQGSTCAVTLEYEAAEGFVLDNVAVVIPLAGASSAPVVQTEVGTHKTQGGQLVWSIGHVDDSNRTGSMEFKVAATDVNRFFPIAVSFRSSTTFCDIGVASVTSGSGAEVPYAEDAVLLSDKYEVV